MNPIVNSSSIMTWETPNSFLELVRKVSPIALDPCTTHNNRVQARRYAAPDITLAPSWPGPQRPFGCVGPNGLEVDWTLFSKGHGLTFVNPPYGRAVPEWTAKMVEEADKGCEIIALLASRTCSRWFHKTAPETDATLFWKGRIHFNDALTGQPAMVFSKKLQKLIPAKATFPSVVLYFGPNVAKFEEVFHAYGILY